MIASLAMMMASSAFAGGSDCCNANGTPGCDDAACQALICGQDPFCCDVEWDQICADAANEQCKVCSGDPPGPTCGKGAGPCGEPNGTPGCDDVECCELICGQDPFCCDVEWDQICADAAIEQCGGKKGPTCGKGAGPCGEPNGTPGCDDVECCELICGQDPFCCDVEWDGICADAANEQCGGKPGSDCCIANGTPGCDDKDCTNLICGQDPFCCDVEWDQICADAASEQCAVCGGDPQPVCGEGAGPCDEPNGTPGCDDVECCKLICAKDPFCCDVEWDQICADAANDLCGKVECECDGDINGNGNVGPADLAALLASWGTPGVGFPCSTDIDGDGNVGPADLAELLANWGSCDDDPQPVCGEGAGPCGEPNGTPGCNDVECCELICGQDPFCCDVEWDQICADAANEQCGGKPGSDCCVANGTPGCDDQACQDLICGQDPFCCDVEWDQICADAANDQCKVCGGGGPGPVCGEGAGPCGEPNGTPGCNDVECCELICGQDPFCCDVEWDQICADAANEQCDGGPGPVCGEGAGPCGEPNGTPGCNDVECCELICGQDPFCCDVEWDGICADAAIEQCGGEPPASDCCVPNGTPGCDEQACQDLICGQDPFCCDVEWDQICADAAIEQCDVCGGGGPTPVCGEGAGPCGEPNGTPGCDDVECCELICAADPFCCDVEWDAICADAANAECGGDPIPVCGEGAGPCGEPNGTPGCDDVDCCEAICAADPFCCEVEWDGICADAANEQCGGGGDPACGEGAGPCGEPNGTPGCDDVNCCETVCANDPFCCDTEWDQICADAAAKLCGS